MQVLTTKHKVLQASSKVYDPLGLLSPVTIQAKLLIQELWKQHVKWDEPLKKGLCDWWGEITDSIQEAATITALQQFFPSAKEQATTPYLHVFADASLKANGPVSYITDGNTSSFIMAKSRVALLKKLPLSQLELMAALIATRLAQHVSQPLNSRYPHLKTKLWSDSEIVLHWLGSTWPLKQFLANCTREITNSFLCHFGTIAQLQTTQLTYLWD